MSDTISGVRIRKELGKQIPAHRLTLSDTQRAVGVEPDTLQEVSYIVGFAARESVPIVPAATLGAAQRAEEWHISLSLARMSAVSDFSEESGLFCAQTGSRVSDLTEWLLDRGQTLAVTPDQSMDMPLWEFLISPDSGRFGPRYGCKWDQVFSLTAIQPNGKLFTNSLSPARATGPDFSRVILQGEGAFGLPLEVYMRVKPLPRRRVILALALKDLVRGVERAWDVAVEARPEYLEIGMNSGMRGSVPKVFAVVELWGEGKNLAVRKERIRKVFGDVAAVADVAHETLLNLESTYGFAREKAFQFFVPRSQTAQTLADIIDESRSGRKKSVRLRVRGFADDQTCVTADGSGPQAWRRSHELSQGLYSSPDGRALLAEVAAALDPGGVFALVPRLWREPDENTA